MIPGQNRKQIRMQIGHLLSSPHHHAQQTLSMIANKYPKGATERSIQFQFSPCFTNDADPQLASSSLLRVEECPRFIKSREEWHPNPRINNSMPIEATITTTSRPLPILSRMRNHTPNQDARPRWLVVWFESSFSANMRFCMTLSLTPLSSSPSLALFIFFSCTCVQLFALLDCMFVLSSEI